MNALSKRLTIVGLLAGGVLAALPASAQQFTLKLSQPTINALMIRAAFVPGNPLHASSDTARLALACAAFAVWACP